MFDLRNLKYAYKNICYKETYDNNDYYFLYQFNDIYLNVKRFFREWLV